MTADTLAVPYLGPDPDRGREPWRGLRATLADGVLTVTLQRPEQANAIGVEMAIDLQRLLAAVADDAAVRVLLLRGVGGNFCAGLDDADFADTARHDASTLRAARAAAEQVCGRLLRVLPQPVLALVRGVCAGEAIGLVEACDIALAAEDARFALPAVAAGGYTSAPTAQALLRVMQPRPARLHALTGQAFDGRQAEAWGLVTRCLAVADLEREAQALATELAAKDALALQFTKETLRHVGSMDWDAVLNFNAAKFAQFQALQAGRPSARAAAVDSFLAGKSKPGLGL